MKRLLAALLLLPLAACATTVRAPAPSGPRLMVDDVDGLALFADELAEARVLVGEWGTSHGLAIADVTRTNEVLARAHQGQDARTGAACGRPLATWMARERWAGELGVEGRLDAAVTCDDARTTCHLVVSTIPTMELGAPSKLRWSAPFDARAPWKKALRASLAALAPHVDEEDGTGGLGILGELAGDGPASARPAKLDVYTSEAHALDAPESLKGAVELGPGLASLGACLGDEASAEVLVAADASGRITRCEPRSGHDAAARCLCDAVAKGKVAPPARGKRFDVSASRDPGDRVAEGKAVVYAYARTHLVAYNTPEGETLFRPLVSDPSISGWQEPRSSALASCFVDRVPGSVGLGVRTTFDATGRAVHAQVRLATKDPAPTPAQIACVERAFLTSRAPCPAVPRAWADAEVRVYAKPLRITSGGGG